MVDAEIGDGNNDAIERSDRCRWTYGRAKLESEDSSYDSDYENSDPLTSPQCYGEASHEEVGRTVSDTLGAEFAEYVGPPAVVPEVTVEKEDGGEDRAILVDPDYTNRVEFSLKLGYTEKQAQIALQKLGSKAEQNELLAELIRLGANESGRSTEPKYTLDCVALTAPSKSVDATVGGREGFGLRHIVIDGSNVAMSHGNKEVFSCRGIKLCVDWFKARGHKEITVFVPLWRKETSRPDAITKDQEVLWELEKERLLVFTPSRQISGRRMACHDDRYILRLAAETDGVVVSNDNYRDLVNENPEYKRVIEERLLMYSFVNDRFMPPDDPLGRHGPSLDTFLRSQSKLLEPLPPSCPYGKKCTYGNKCKYYHPERGNQPHKSVSEQLVEQAKINIQEVKTRNIKIHEHLTEGSKLKGTLSSPLPGSKTVDRLPAKMALHRTKSLLVPADSTSDAQTISEAKRLDGRIKQTPIDSSQGSFSLWKEDGGSFMASSTSSPPMSTWSSSLYDDCGNHLSVAKRLSDPDSRKAVQGEAGNMHRKLQRQLTLNPCYDPRLAHMKSFEPPITGSLISDSDAASPSHPKEHAALTRHCSASTADALSNVRANWGTPDNHHQAVARIASAPDSYRQWRPSASHPRRATSTSDVQLQHYDATSFFWGPVALPPGGPSVPVPSLHSGQMRSWQKSSLAPPTHGPTGIMTPNMSFEDQRRFLYYHLASVFPEEQVRAAMEINPDETNPQAICARILTMFPRPK